MLKIIVPFVWLLSAAVFVFVSHRIARFRVDHPKWEQDRYFGTPQNTLGTFRLATYTPAGHRLYPFLIGSFFIFVVLTVFAVILIEQLF